MITKTFAWMTLGAISVLAMVGGCSAEAGQDAASSAAPITASLGAEADRASAEEKTIDLAFSGPAWGSDPRGREVALETFLADVGESAEALARGADRAADYLGGPAAPDAPLQHLVVTTGGKRSHDANVIACFWPDGPCCVCRSNPASCICPN